MIITDQIKSLNRKIIHNEAQYDLARKAAKISALSSNNLNKYDYLTGEDLDLKPSTVEQAKFEYSPLGKIFNKGLDKDDKKEGLFKRLENIKDKNEEQLQANKDQGEKQLKELKKKLVWTKTDGTKYDRFALPLKLIEKIHNYEITLDEAIEEQTELRILINKLNNDYIPRIPEKKEKNRVLESARKLSDARKIILLIFLKKEIFRIKVVHLKPKKKNQKKNQKKTS